MANAILLHQTMPMYIYEKLNDEYQKIRYRFTLSTRIEMPKTKSNTKRYQNSTVFFYVSFCFAPTPFTSFCSIYKKCHEGTRFFSHKFSVCFCVGKKAGKHQSLSIGWRLTSYFCNLTKLDKMKSSSFVASVQPHHQAA